ncbi:MAG TPA: ATP-binding protein, partial [Geminicoccaceae bacterium]|nr:ATP-binding protein [Geminicoccaceae bacterium]
MHLRAAAQPHLRRDGGALRHGDRPGPTPQAARQGQACVEDVDFAAARGLDRRLFKELATGQWLKSHQNLIITGACGTGKTWLACALGHTAARTEFTVLYQRLPRLFADL